MARREFVKNWKKNRNTRGKNRKRQLTFQPLESRELMAVMSPFQPLTLNTPNTLPPVGPVVVDPLPPLPPAPTLGAKLENGVLTVTGTHEADNLFIFAHEGQVQVREHLKDVTLLSVPKGLVQSIVVNANRGDDWVEIDQSINIPATLNGDLGNDRLEGGAAGDNISGGSGNDEILGRGGNDNLRGDNGDDLLVGGDGNDIIFGGLGNDYLVGGAGNDALAGEAGNDQIFGEAGNDVLHGWQGDDLLDGGDGDDALYGNEGKDELFGGNGHDFLRGFEGDDGIRGEGGNDEIVADSGNDVVDGGDGNDSISGGIGNDALSGGNGNDVIFGGNDQDWIDGAAGDDVLHGGAGNDFLQGGAGVDSLDGAAGENVLHQEYAPGQEPLGQTQVIPLFFPIVDDAIELVEDIVDGIVDVFKWTVDKVSAIGNSFWNWATHLDDRVVRLAEDLTGALSNWPWEADFWKGLGRAVVDTLEIGGLGEAWEIAFEILKPWQRGMTSAEIAVARSVFGDSIPYHMVRMDEHSLMAAIGRTHVTGYIINSTENLDDLTMIHELTHVWQYETGGLVYIPDAIGGQVSDEGYEYGGPTKAEKLADLQAKIAAGKRISAYNPEQQGAIVADYFELIQEARQDYEAKGLIAPKSLREKLDVYIHFVKEVSTLTARQLDTPDPAPTVRPIVTQVTQVFGNKLLPQFGSGPQGPRLPLPRR